MSNSTPSTLPWSKAWEETSIATESTSFSHVESDECIVTGSGVVVLLASIWPKSPRPNVPINALFFLSLWLANPRIYETVVFPFVPVTPTIFIFLDGCP